MTIGFGLDLAGYSTGKSGFASAHVKNGIEVCIYRGHAFSTKPKEKQSFKAYVDLERELLTACCQQGQIMVDIPIDLQGLPFIEDVSFFWQLTQRPVDYAFKAMPPLADRIGSPVGRFQYMIKTLPKAWIGTHIFETYPAQSLKLMNIHIEGYKKKVGKTSPTIIFENGQWQGGKMATMANRLGLKATEATTLNDDEFDAVICAVTAVAGEQGLLKGKPLNDLISAKINAGSFSAPASYVLLQKLPEAEIYVTRKIVNDQNEMLAEIAAL